MTSRPHVPAAHAVLTPALGALPRSSHAAPGRPPEAIWAQVMDRLQKELGEAAFLNWLKPLTFDACQDGELRILADRPVVRDWVRSHYADRILDLWAAEAPGTTSIEVALGAAASRLAREVCEPPPVAPALARAPARGHDGQELRHVLDPRLTFENFVVGAPNEFAYAAARRVADRFANGRISEPAAETVKSNPLFLYGGVGLGKTHLMHAIAWSISRSNPGCRVMYLSAEKFMHQFIVALRGRDTISFKDQFRSADVLMIDDIQFMCGKESTQDEFFHTFNALVDQRRSIVVSADKSPTDLEGLEERLRNRLGWGLVADIHPTSYELRLAILQAKAEQIPMTLPPKVLEFLAHRIASNVRELEGALNRIVAHAELVGRPVTLETTQELLADLLRANDRRITIDEIQRKVAEHFNIKITEMKSDRRARIVARPRQVAMYLAKQLTTRSLPEIGQRFDRDHTTVIHAVRKVEELIALDTGFAEDVALLRRALAG